jgi:hypothetical protein
MDRIENVASINSTLPQELLYRTVAWQRQGIHRQTYPHIPLTQHGSHRKRVGVAKQRLGKHPSLCLAIYGDTQTDTY